MNNNLNKNGISQIPRKIKVISPTGITTVYEKSVYDPATRTIRTQSGEVIHPGLSDRIEEVPDTDACFVATAVYEDPMAPQVQALRKFRDEVILPHWIGGKEIVALYYKVGPHLAKVLYRLPFLKWLTKRLLDVFIRWVHMDADK